MKDIMLLDKLIKVMSVTIDDHDISFNEIQNVYTNLRKKEPELFTKPMEEGDKWALRIIKKTDKQYRYRCYVRTVFSCIEALSFNIKRLALFGYRESDKSIREKVKPEYKKLSNGKLSVEDNIKYSFRLFSKTHSRYSYHIEPGNKNWDNFIKAINIRYRVTHPKTKKDFYLTRNDIKDVHKAYDLFINELNHLISIWH